MKPRTQAEILRAAEIFNTAATSRAAQADPTTILVRASVLSNVLLLRWAAGEDNSVTELLDRIAVNHAAATGKAD